MPQQGQRCGRGGIEKEEAEPDAGHQPDLLGGERHHMPLVGGNEDEHVDEAENIVCQRLQSGNETLQSPDCQHGRGQREMVFAAERLQSLGEEGEQRQEDGVGGGVPPDTCAQRREASDHEFRAEVRPVEYKVERHEDEAIEQEFAFHDPYALEVGFDGLFPVEEEPCGDGEEDDHAHLAAALHHELEEDPLRPQGEIQHVVAVVDDEVVHEDHEHRDDAQQLDAGVSPPPFAIWECASAPCLPCMPFPFVLWMLSFMVLPSGFVLSREIIWSRNDRDGGVPFLRLKSSANGVVESAAGLQ